MFPFGIITLKWARILIGAKDTNAVIEKNYCLLCPCMIRNEGQQAAQSHSENKNLVQ